MPPADPPAASAEREAERRPRTVEQARDALERLIAAAWRKPGRAAFTIPADPDRDADLILDDVIDEWAGLRDRLRAARAALEHARGALEVIHGDATAEAFDANVDVRIAAVAADAMRALDAATSSDRG